MILILHNSVHLDINKTFSKKNNSFYFDYFRGMNTQINLTIQSLSILNTGIIW